MTQFNLLPDVKLEYIRARRMKRLVMSASIALAAIAVAIFIGLFLIVNVVQKRHMSNLDKDIQAGVAELQAVPDINKVLTVQSQLSKLTGLHEQKPAASRLVDYLGRITPAAASISQASLNFEEGTLSISGSANSLETVNKYADTLKFTTFTVEGVEGDGQPAFSEVVLSSFGVSNDQGASYQLDFKFNPEIFDNTKKVTLKVPEIISTRSQTEKPSDLFQRAEEEGDQ